MLPMCSLTTEKATKAGLLCASFFFLVTTMSLVEKSWDD
jgi:hypothetical protein